MEAVPLAVRDAMLPADEVELTEASDVAGDEVVTELAEVPVREAAATVAGASALTALTPTCLGLLPTPNLRFFTSTMSKSKARSMTVAKSPLEAWWPSSSCA